MVFKSTARVRFLKLYHLELVLGKWIFSSREFKKNELESLEGLPKGPKTREGLQRGGLQPLRTSEVRALGQ